MPDVDAFAVYRGDELVLALLRQPGAVRAGELVITARHEQLTAHARTLDPPLLALVTRAEDLDALLDALQAHGLRVAKTPARALAWAFR